MTEKQKVIYNVIQEFLEINGYSPTIRELCKIVGLRSSATMYVHLKKMKAKGVLDYKERRSRTIVLNKIEEE